ncbi:24-amino acid repeat protein [Fulvivirga imtechensis AK7]|uniref:24-amino acid repeat protein n=1 Tax=Fulvivirga imtechensis AK7 TaxID=1237149 RepID=L8JPX2_9BACT|nr:toxin-antitoxin system YwqK family antitoxin [Fulvivirga imtechensis]ELR71011.1 24-amino acid repeat protein [Fulvivirga imtechensis AK7]
MKSSPYHFILFVVFAIFLGGCDSLDRTSGKKSGKKEGVVKQYYPDGSLKNEITFADGKKNGVAKNYYKNGRLRQQVSYLNNVKHGDVITYYESGSKYQVTPYVNGEIHGLRKKFRVDGRLLAEVPYVNNEACRGLKEYLTDGELKTRYPTIVVEEIDNLLRSNEFTLRISVSDNSKKVVYYIGELDEQGCISADAMRLEPQRPGVLDIKYHLGPGMFIMEELNIIAVVQTRLGNPYITEKKYNLAIENRG